MANTSYWRALKKLGIKIPGKPSDSLPVAKPDKSKDELGVRVGGKPVIKPKEEKPVEKPEEAKELTPLEKLEYLRRIGQPLPEGIGIIPTMRPPEKYIPGMRLTPMQIAEVEAKKEIYKGVSEKEKQVLPDVINLTQVYYDNKLDEKARELGMSIELDQGGKVVYVYEREEQRQEFETYKTVAEQEAIEYGTNIYSERMGEYDVKSVYEQKYKEEMEKAGYHEIEISGKQIYVTEKQYRDIKQKELIRSRMTGERGPVERVAEMFRFWYTGFTPENLFYTTTLYELGVLDIFKYGYGGGSGLARGIHEVMAKPKDVLGEKFLTSYSESIRRTEEAKTKYGWFGVFARSYEPGGFGFAGSMYAVMSGIGAVSSKIGGAIGVTGKTIPVVSKFKSVVPYIVGTGIGSYTGAELGYTLAMEQKGRLPPGTTGLKAVRTATGWGALLGFGYLSTQPSMQIIPHRYEPRYDIFKTPKGSFEVISVKKYIPVFGKKLFYGSDIPIAMRMSWIKPYMYGKTLVLIPKFSMTPVITGYTTGLTGVDTSKAIVSISEIKAGQKITYDLFTKQKTVTDMVLPVKPFVYEHKFIPPSKKVLSVEDLMMKKEELDIFSKIDKATKLTKIEQFPRGSFLVTNKETIRIEKNILKDTKQYIVKKEKSVKPITKERYKAWDITKKDLARWEIQKNLAYNALQGLKPIGKDVSVSKKTLQKPLIEKTVPPTKPFVYEHKFIPPSKKVMSLEEIYIKQKEIALKKWFEKSKPVKIIPKTTQVTLKSFYEPSSKIDIVLFEKPKPFIVSKPKIKTIGKPLTDKDILTKIISVRSLKPEVLSPWEQKVKTDIIMGETIKVSSHWEGKAPSIKSSYKEYFKHVVLPVANIDMVNKSFQSNYNNLNYKAILDIDNMTNVLQHSNIIRKTDNFVNTITGVVEIQQLEQGNIQLQKQLQQQIQLQDLLVGQKNIFRTQVEKPVVEVPIVSTQLESIPVEIKTVLGMSSYDVYIKKRQFKEGKRIRGTEWVKVNKEPLRELDAKALGAKKIGDTAKASFKIVVTDGKPVRLGRSVKSWGSIMHQFYEKGKSNVFVEKSMFRIDSPGEINEISRLGWEARRSGKGNKKIKRSNNIINKMFGV